MPKQKRKRLTPVPVWPKIGDALKGEHNTYFLGSVIASGAYSFVFDGIDYFGNPVVLKVFKPNNRLFTEVGDQWYKESTFCQELRHPNVVTILDAFYTGNLFYIVLEKGDRSLFQFVMDNGGRLRPQTVKEIGRQLLSGLHFIHTKGTIQRDLTVDNVLVYNSWAALPVFKISDFGISDNLLGTGYQVSLKKEANPLYLPPEFIKLGMTDTQSDLYHLGLTLFFCLTGQFTFSGNMRQSEIERLINNGLPRIMAESLKTPLGDFIAKLLRRTKSYRFKSAIAAWNELRVL